MPGRDWQCQECGYKNFSRRPDCGQCGEEPALQPHLIGRMSQKGKGSHWWCHDCGGRHAVDVYLKCPNPVRGRKGGDWNANNSGWVPPGNQSGPQQQGGKGGNWNGNNSGWVPPGNQSGPPQQGGNQGGWGQGQQPGYQKQNWTSGQQNNQQSYQQGQGPEGWGVSGKGSNDPWTTYLEKQHGGGVESRQQGWSGPAPDNNSGWWNSQGQGQSNAQGGGGQWKDNSGGQWYGSRSDQGWKRGGSGNSKKNSWPQQDSWSKDQGGWSSSNWGSQKQRSQPESSPGGHKQRGPEKEPSVEHESEDDQQANSWSQKCEGCEQTVPISRMKKTHQLGGNVREEARCPECYVEYQRGVYHVQMMENMYCGIISVDRFDNWATGPEVRQALCTMVEKCAKQLGYRLRSVPEQAERAGSPVADGPGDAGGGGDAQGTGDGAGSVSGHSCGTTVMSMWEFVESGQTPVFESSGPAKNRKAETAGSLPESGSSPPPPQKEEPRLPPQPQPQQASSSSSSSSTSAPPATV